MRLLNVFTLEFAQLRSDAIPPYAIASHLWYEEEATFHDVRDRRNKDRRGYKKVESFAKYVREFIPSVQWLWIDTCCIDKDSSAELSETMNLVFTWYRNAEVCLVYLTDIETYTNKSEFLKSKWFARVWTLQELLAPRTVVFLTNAWQVIGNKGASSCGYNGTICGPGLEQNIAEITGISESVLHDYTASLNLTVNERLEWVKGRAATRAEDMSYALYGIFGVMPGANYGEGFHGARQRLLAAITQKNQERHLQYSPLADPSSQIRILTIFNTVRNDGPIRCSLSRTSLNSAPDYVALSYHWGSSKSRGSIFVTETGDASGEGVFSVTANLEDALRELRRRGIFRVWADMICINQENISERNQQVRLMGRIYADAVKVVAWVGLERDGSSSAIHAMLCKVPQPHDASNRASSELSALPDGLRSFFSRPYFTRMWIIQELAKAQEAELWCGQDTVPLDAVTAFLSHSKDANLTSSQKTRFDAIRLFREHERRSLIGTPRMLLSEALVISRSSMASDPRDNIYAILGLTLDGEHIVKQPDYSSSVEDVFADASTRLVGLQGHISLILLARGSYTAGCKPSWIPDWSERTPLPPWITECLRRGRDTLEFTCSTSQNILSVRGCLIDEIWEDASKERFSEADHNMRTLSQGRRLSMQNWLEEFMKDDFHVQAARCRMDKPFLAKFTSIARRRMDKLFLAKFTSTAQPASAYREKQLLVLESGVQAVAQYSMRFAQLKHRGIRIVYRHAEHRDQIWRLENCPLPVILRPLPNNRFLFIGEVYADIRDQRWWESTWKDFTNSDGTYIKNVSSTDVAFHKCNSVSIYIE